MFIIAFHVFLRVGEMAGSSKHVLQYDQVNVMHDSFTVIFKSFKHHSGTPLTLVVKASACPCPVQALKQYLSLRGSAPGPLFLTSSHTTVSRELFTQQLHSALAWVGLNTHNYKAHSFRIGAATHAALLGYADSEIQAMGRWKSGAFKKYIRLPTVSM
jgi:site-specific recombinase XerD